MKPIEELTNDELRQEIAEHQGWTDIDGNTYDWPIGTRPDSGIRQFVPHWSTDANDAIALMDSVPTKFQVEICRRRKTTSVTCSIWHWPGEDSVSVTYCAPTLSLAIALAVCAAYRKGMLESKKGAVCG